jgi:hypothetical protein
MSCDLCLHIKTNGIRCASPALRGGDWCYFHNRLHNTHRGVRRHPVGTAPTHLRSLPPLEDRESIQVGISAVFASLAAGLIDARHARALFHGLQLAAANVGFLRLKVYSDEAPTLAYAATPDGFHLAEPSRIEQLLRETPTDRSS